MSTTKAKIQARVNSQLASASSITATEHRETLTTNVDSFLEAIYEDVSEEVSSGTHAYTNPHNANISYVVKMQKVGRSVTINGKMTNATAGFLVDPEVLTIDGTDLLQATGTYYGYTSNGLEVKLSSNILSLGSALAPSESLNFSITYNTIA